MYIGINKFSASASDHKPLHVLRIQQEVAYICIYITLHEYFKFDVYVSQFCFNTASKVARYTVKHKSFMMEKLMYLMNSQRFIEVFPTKLCPLYLSPMKFIINLSKSFHAGLISPSFSQLRFCTIWYIW